ncbi:hypothetical protein N0V90_008669 [Kalmusia sp. IMI 367209]|nr:hypothetical protein N0V90_008669 [Kalmusia sp. IMI 367209]
MLFLQRTSYLAILALLGQLHALALPESDWEVVHPPDLFPRDPFDVSKYASLGESFASGPSAGDRYDDTKCRRYKKAFGPQVAEDDRIHGPKPIDFSFIACSGSRTWHIFEDRPSGKVKQSQASQLKDKNPDMVTLSIGGNDIGFATLLDRCVYRFYQSHINACRGCHWFWFDDCTNDCNAAMKEVEGNIDSEKFASDLSRAIQAIFDFAPRTKLFITGYPEFWNDKTDYCDNVSFKLNCPNNYVLPLTKERRRGMNWLTWKLNDKIQATIRNWPTGADIHYVDTNSHFAGHRFCEEGVREPSYRNPDIWFYPLEYTTSGQSVNFDGKGSNIPSGDCKALLEDGDQGDYFTCLMANGVLDNNTSIDLNNMRNNVPGDGEVAITSGSDLPDWIARVFHPNINGMTAYRDAIVQAYNDYQPASAPSPSAKPSQSPKPNPSPLPSPTPQPTKAISVVLSDTIPPGTQTNIFSWRIFAVDVGKDGACGRDVKSLLHNGRDTWETDFSDHTLDYPVWPGGTFPLNKLFGEEGCTFKCDGTNAGALFCPSFNGNGVGCRADPAKTAGPGAIIKCGSEKNYVWEHATVYCEW